MIVWIWMIIRTFFGWNWDKEIIYDENTWFIEKITNTWDQTTTWNLTEIDITSPENPSQNGRTEIRVIMPRYFYTSGWKNFAEDLYNDQNVYINFIFRNDLNVYRDEISNNNFSIADLMLFPYDWNEMVDTKTFKPWSGFWSNFDPFVAKIFSEKSSFSFRPFAADPMVLYASVSPAPRDFRDISDLIYDRNPTVQLAFPVFFGILNDDYSNEWFQWEYQDIMRYALMHYFKKYGDSPSLLKRIDINVFENSSEIRNYNLSDLNYILGIIDTPECRYFPAICFQIWNFVGVRFWFLSDADIVKRYFANKQSNFDNLAKTTVPFFWFESPVRLRWRWVSNKIEDPAVLQAIQTFMAKFINSHDQYKLRSSTLSVFNSEEGNSIEKGNSLRNNHYIWSRWYILETWWDYINTIRNTSSFWQLLWHEISAETYLTRSM